MKVTIIEIRYEVQSLYHAKLLMNGDIDWINSIAF